MNVALITAGGKGRRLSDKFKKQFVLIKNRPLIFWTIDKFVCSAKLEKIIITLPKTETKEYKDLIEKEYPDGDIEVICGGEKRQDSVLKGLRTCPETTNFVLIHDGVRPFVTTQEIDKLVDFVKEKKGAIPVCTPKNTIKRVKSSRVVQTLDRSKLVNVLTPQAFSFPLILRLHKRAKQEGLYFTDDAAILEYYGFQVFTLETSSQNFKITDKADLKMAELLIKNLGVENEV